MRTDRFTELIRRKLESIRPEFQDKDWQRMQASLQQAGLSDPDGSGTVQPLHGAGWYARPWLVAAASISSIVLLALSVWQHAEINQLRQAVSQLRQSPSSTVRQPQPGSGLPVDKLAAPPTASQSQSAHPTVSKNESALTSIPSRIDTVYITRYVPVPAQPGTELPASRSQAGTERYTGTDRSRPQSTPSLPPESPSANPLTRQEIAGHQPTQSTNDQSNLPSYDPTSTRTLLTTKRKNRQDHDSARPSANSSSPVRNPISSADGSEGSRTDLAGATGVAPTNAAEPGGSLATAQPAAENPAAPVETAYQPVNTRPFALKPVDWNGLLSRRLKRTRSAVTQPAAPAVAQAPESQHIDPIAVNVRLGVGMDLQPQLFSLGAVSEFVFANRWTLSLGLAQSTYKVGSYANDEDFKYRTRRNFRYEYAPPPGFDPKREIYSISLKTTRYQIPLQIGYRVPLNQHLSLTPALGTYLNLTSTAHVSFSYPKPMFGGYNGFESVEFTKKLPVDLISSYTASATVEWQQGHWVAQGGLLLTKPLQATMNWASEPSFGARLRLFYQL
ncbi:hypothetical protein GGR92_003702 [Spirosoma lacussanchae]|uniref:hypothetical protein n=1 Tax=Spirosoma lacussanchae TaxID=1884249 RepID=UPI001109FBF8|nr:hypothetical protein [Spirosoma lacussanchae]